MANGMFNAEEFRRAGQVLRRYSAIMSANLRGVAASGAVIMLDESRRAINKKTGKTAASLRVNVSHSVAGAKLELYGDKVAKYLASGTRAHIILPRHGQYLRFVGRGGVVYARQVRHPGTRAYPWRLRAMVSISPKIRALGSAAIKASIRELKGEMGQ